MTGPTIVDEDGKVYSFEGLPRHYYEHLPVEAELTFRTPIDPRRMTRKQRMQYLLTGDVHVEGETIRVPLERDGKPLTWGDVHGWSAGVAEGWKPTRFDPPPPSGEVLDVDFEECE